MRKRLLTLFILVYTVALSQQPSYFLFGEEQFRGIQIYDVTQDNESNYIISTNEGLYYYDFHGFKKMECPEAKSSSVFAFVNGKHGEIYCHNLNAQIFVIKKLKCNLFFELNEDQARSDITMLCDNNGNLVVGAKQILVIDSSSKIIFKKDLPLRFLGTFFRTGSGDIIYHLNQTDSIWRYSNGTITTHPIKYHEARPKDDWLLKFYRIDSVCYAFETHARHQYKFNETTFELTAIKDNSAFIRGVSNRAYSTPGKLWITGSLPGVGLVSNENYENDTSILYPNFYISDVYYDHEGNILLSTFDKGILLIPDTDVPDVISNFSDDPITAITRTSGGDLLLGSSKGNIIKYKNNKFITISNAGKRPIDNIYSSSINSSVIFDDGLLKCLNIKTSKTTSIYQVSLKDVAFINADSVFIGTNIGVFIVNTSKREMDNNQFTDLNTRVYSIEYDPENQNLYSSTARGLYVSNTHFGAKKIKLNGKDIFTSSLLLFEDQLLAATRKNGVYIIKDSTVVDSFIPSIGGRMETIRKMLPYKNSIISSTSSGLFQFDLKGNLLRSFDPLIGSGTKKIINYFIEGDTLWVSHSGGVQKVDLKYVETINTKPQIRLDAIFVNGNLSSQTPSRSYSSSERKFQFSISSPTIRNAVNTILQYRLINYDTEWQSTDFKNSIITYNALDPGTYTFEAKAELDGISSEIIHYSFTIKKPIEAQWWFIGLSSLLFIIIVLIIFRWQLNVQRKKSKQINELNASKLTAIQSQMNPHFIFNSLNSIQDLILKGDTEHSYTYIATFSNLVRKTLKYSEKDFIDFEQEIQLLEIYLSLEKLRFKKDFNYQLITNDIEDIMIPPLLVQPFIENSLIHGLLHKEGMKELIIDFRLSGEELLCTISDNGVGRERSKAIKVRQKSEHESFSGKAIKNRFDILSNVFKGSFGYTYEDIIVNGAVCGTKVTLTIPIRHKF